MSVIILEMDDYDRMKVYVSGYTQIQKLMQNN